jgi:hypothetical protein
MQLNRARQREMLQALADVYPSYAVDFLRKDAELEDLANLWYLREHDLIKSPMEHTLTGAIIFEGATITAKGLDFLADDGGLSAILGTLTVRLHADTIRELLLSRIDQIALPSEQKGWLKKSVETMSTEALKILVKSLLEKGLEAGPDLLAMAKAAMESIKG